MLIPFPFGRGRLLEAGGMYAYGVHPVLTFGPKWGRDFGNARESGDFRRIRSRGEIGSFRYSVSKLGDREVLQAA